MKTLYSKFTLTTLLLMIGSLFIGFFITNTYYHQVIKAPNDEKNIEIAKQMVTYIEQQQNLVLQDYLSMLGEVGYQLYVVNDKGEGQFYGGAYRDKVLPQSAVAQVLNGETYHGMRDFPKETFVTGFFANELVNTVGVPFSYKDETYALFMRPNIKLLFSEVHRILGALMAAMFILSLIGVMLLARTIINPIKKLTIATHNVADEQFATALNIEREDEIGQLANSFQQMSQQLQENDLLRKEFISNVSHDFQSPLLNIEGYTKLIATATTEAERLEYAAIIEVETKRLSNLTKQLLLLNTLDSSKRLLKSKPFSLSTQLRETIRKYRWQLEEKELELTYEIEEFTYNGDENLLQNVWDNLLTNAIKYNVQGGHITVKAQPSQGAIMICIQDSGIGMTTDDQLRIFERFYRADRARTAHGTGLGMPIVKQIIERHQGTIHIDSQENNGTTIIVTLPCL